MGRAKNDRLWAPTTEDIKKSQMSGFISFLCSKGYLSKGASWNELHHWSVIFLEKFWAQYLEYSDLILQQNYHTVLDRGGRFQEARWFVGAKLNFAQNVLRNRNNQTAIVSYIEGSLNSSLNYNELYECVSQLQQALLAMDVKAGDRVCAMMPNIPETVIAMLAVVSIGAVWSSCSPDFGEQAVLDRFGQIKPVVFFSVDSILYKGKKIDCMEKTTRLIQKIDSIERCIMVSFRGSNAGRHGSENIYKQHHINTNNKKGRNFSSLVEAKMVWWKDFVLDYDPKKEVQFQYFGFDHPVVIMFSSGTTGLPKCIVQGAGILLNHNKEHRLHCQIKETSSVFFYTTCGWMMWNWLISVLFTGAKVVLYDGNPLFPDVDVLWKMVKSESIDVFGCSPKYLSLLEENEFDADITCLPSLKTILTTGAPMTSSLFDYVYMKIDKDVQVSSIAGGTDLNGCFGLGNPMLPVYSGEIQGLGLGMDVDIFDDQGESVVGSEGELVCKSPFPSMPLSFWNDPAGSKYESAYFSQDKDIWYHGDFAEITKKGTLVIYGRSDATLNPGGVRLGTSDIYNLLESFVEVSDSVIIAQPWKGDVRIVLFVVLHFGVDLESSLATRIQKTIKDKLSPRHVPEVILKVDGIPYTHNGKKVELAVKNTVMGKVVKNTSSLTNPEVLRFFENMKELQDDV